MRLPVKAVIGTLLLFLFAGSIITGCSQTKGTEDVKEIGEERIPVETVKTSKDNFEITKEYYGKLKAAQDIMIIPKLPGKALRINAQIGEPVKKGDVLIELEGSDVDLQIAQAQAAYNTAKLTVDSSKDKIERLKDEQKDVEEGIDKLDQAIDKVNEGLEEVQKGLDRMDESLKAGIIDEVQYGVSKAQLDMQKQSLEEQKAKLEEQRSSLQSAGKSLEGTLQSLPSGELLNAQLKQAQAGLDLALNARNSLKITSPIDGVVATLTAEEGEMVSQAMPPVSVIDLANVVLDINLTEYEVTKVHPDSSIQVYVDAVGKEPVTGEIITVSPAPDQRSQAYPVKISIPNPKEELKPGMFARALLVIDKAENSIVIPKKSVVREKDELFVFVVKGDTVEKKKIQTGLEDGESIVVTSGLSDGEEVVTKGQAYLKDGVKIQVVRGDEE